MFEYAKVTRSSDSTLDCVGLISTKNYKGVEIISQKQIDAMPNVDDVGILLMVMNGEYVWLGNLEQFLNGLLMNELRIHPKNKTGIFFSGQEQADQEVEVYRAITSIDGEEPNQKYQYAVTERIKIKKDGTIELSRLDINGTPTSSIVMNNDDSIDITGTVINLN